MQHDIDYVLYDPYSPHNRQEAIEWDRQHKFQQQKEKELKRLMRNCRVVRKPNKQKFHKSGENINSPLKEFDTVQWINKEGEVVYSKDIEKSENLTKVIFDTFRNRL